MLTKSDSAKHWQECDCGEKINIETHDFSYSNQTESSHTEACAECDYIATVSHTKGYCEYNSLANHNIYCNCGEFLGREVHTTITKMGKTYCKGCLHVFDSGSIHPVNGSKDKPETITE